jgi:hypothetical protein
VGKFGIGRRHESVCISGSRLRSCFCCYKLIRYLITFSVDPDFIPCYPSLSFYLSLVPSNDDHIEYMSRVGAR